LGILNWTLHEAGPERTGPKFSEQPYSRSLIRCKETNRIFFINIVEIKGRAMIFFLNFESRGEEGHVTLEIPHFLEALLFVNFIEGKVSPWSKLM